MGILKAATIRGAFYDIDFSGCVIEGTIFAGCSFERCDFSAASLKATLFEDCKFDHETEKTLAPNALVVEIERNKS